MPCADARLAPLLSVLRVPEVRSLAVLLLGASPWDSGQEVPRTALLGDTGISRLLALDTAPAPLLDWLAAQAPNRLGRLAEALLAFWFTQAPHIRLAAANRLVYGQGHVIGEFDFLVWLDGEPWHLETASKFFLLVDDGQRQDWIGTSLHDAQLLKQASLQRQLALSRHPAARSSLPAGFAGCRSGSILRGQHFRPLTLAGEQEPSWGHAVRPMLDPSHRQVVLPRLDWLAPACLEPDALAASLSGTRQTPALLAELAPAGNGDWQEVRRHLCVPPGWPQPEPLKRLQARIDALASQP